MMNRHQVDPSEILTQIVYLLNQITSSFTIFVTSLVGLAVSLILGFELIAAGYMLGICFQVWSFIMNVSNQKKETEANQETSINDLKSLAQRTFVMMSVDIWAKILFFTHTLGLSALLIAKAFGY